MANFFEWDAARYGLQLPEMDEEHQAIIASMNRLHTLHESSAKREDLRKELERLVALTTRHFADEEAYMNRIGYPDLHKHKLIHKGLLEKIMHHKQQFDGTGICTEEFFVFLKMWLKSHICGIDVQYAAHGRKGMAA